MGDKRFVVAHQPRIEEGYFLIRRWTLPALLLFAFGCSGTDECGAGFVRIGNACVAQVPDGGMESCNGIDDDLDGNVDEGDPSAGMPCGSGVGVCTIGELTCVDGALACDGEVGGEEVCNGLDDDCNGMVDESLLTTFYRDADSDGVGGDETCEACTIEECDGEGWVTTTGDCNEECDTCLPGAPEVCDTLDNDCDTETDEAVQTLIFPDLDGDGFGTGAGIPECLDADGFPPIGFSIQGGDCADEDARANPDATDMYATPVRGVTDASVDFDYNCDGLEERIHDPCPSCRNGGCWVAVLGTPNREHDPACGAPGRAVKADVILEMCTQNHSRWEHIDVPCR